MKKRIKRFMIFLAIILPVCSLNAQNKSISIKAENMSIKEVLRSIESQTDYTFSYNNGQVKTDLKISENFNNMKVTDILDKILKPNGINYAVQGKQIILSDAKNSGATQQPQQPGVKLSGRVIDRNGEALPGVTIQIAGTTRGVITDENGNLEMENVAVGTKMIATFIGMQNKEFTFEGKPNMIIVMEENTK